MDKCSVVVCSCDAYQDIWGAFFSLFKQNWKNINYPVILNTESLHFSMDGLNIITYSLYGRNEQVAWSKRLLETLKKVDSEYVIILLDDYLIESPVREDVLNRCIRYMDEDPDIASFSFKKQSGPYVANAGVEGFALKDKKARYRMACQAGIWRKELLMKYLRPHESAWQFEVWGSIRSRRYPWKLYCSNTPATEAFDYCDGRIIIRGKYYRPDVERIEQKLNIKLNTGERGFTDIDLFNMPPRSLKERIKRYSKFKTYSDVIKSLI